jgi:hypothetical protein
MKRGAAPQFRSVITHSGILWEISILTAFKMPSLGSSLSEGRLGSELVEYAPQRARRERVAVVLNDVV